MEGVGAYALVDIFFKRSGIKTEFPIVPMVLSTVRKLEHKEACFILFFFTFIGKFYPRDSALSSVDISCVICRAEVEGANQQQKRQIHNSVGAAGVQSGGQKRLERQQEKSRHMAALGRE